MTAPTLPRVRIRRPTAPRISMPSTPWLLGLLAAAWAAVIGLGLAVVPMLVLWMTTADSGLTWVQAVRLGGVLWLVANGGAVTIAGVSVSLLPWGLVLIALLLLCYAGAWAARRSGRGTPRAALELLLSGAVLYAAVTAVLAVATSEPGSSVDVLPAVGSAFAVAVVGLGLGYLRAAGLPGGARLPEIVTTVVRAGLIAAFVLVALGAVAATIVLIMHFDDAVTMAQALETGVAGGLGLLGLGIAYVPVMAVWGTAYVMGAGILIGPGITVSPFLATSVPTALPPFPLLAALPDGAAVIGWLLPLSGVIAGVLAGALIARRARTQPRLTRLAMAACAAGVAGVVLGILALLASGGIGDQRLAELGPVPMTVGILGAVLVALGAVPSAMSGRSADRPHLSVAGPDELATGSLVEEASREDA